MNLPALISLLESKGLPPAEILEALKAASQPADRSANAERQARFRQRKAGNRVRSVTRNVTPPSPEVSEGSPIPPPILPNPIPKKTPKGVQKGVSEGEQTLVASGMTLDTLRDWKAVREARKCGPISRHVADGFLRECGIAGLTPEAAAIHCIENNWLRFRAEFVKSQPRAGPIRPNGLTTFGALATEFENATRREEDSARSRTIEGTCFDTGT